MPGAAPAQESLLFEAVPSLVRRTRIALMRNAMGESRGGHKRPKAKRRFLIKPSPKGLTQRALIGMLVGGASAFLLLYDHFGLWDLLSPAFYCGVACAVVIGWLFPPPKVCVFVGVDGVVVWGRFIPYAAIEGVRQEWRYRPANSSSVKDTAMSEADIWTIFLDLRGGESLLVETLEYDRSGTDSRVPEHQNDRAADVVQAMEAGISAWHAGYDGPEPSQEELIARGGRTTSEWVSSLRRLGTGSTAPYRGLAVDLEELARVLAEPLARPTARAAAAVALAAAGDKAATKKLRIAASEMGDTRLRIALEKVAAEAKDEAVVEALEAIEALEARHARQALHADIEDDVR